MEQEEEVVAAAAREDEDSQLIYRIERPVYNETLIQAQLLKRKEDTTTNCQKLAEKFHPCSTGLAYAMLAAVPPVYGLYSSFYPVLLYTFFGTSRHISVGTFAVISLMIGGVAVREAPDSMFMNINATGANASDAINVELRDKSRVQVAVMVTTLAGLIQIVLGLLRFGFVAIYLTEPLVRGFTTAASMHVVISQLKYLLGVETQRELIALGLCNFISSFFQTFAVTCSMSRSLVQESTGGKTQIAGLLASLLVLVVVVAVGFVFEPLPQTALAAIIMVNLIGMFKQFRDIPSLWRTSKIELAIWVIAFIASVLLGLDYGLLVAVTFAILTVIYRTQSPKTSILGHVANTGLYCDVDEYEEAAEYEGIKIFHSNSSIYFANSDLYVNSLKEKTGLNPEHLQAARKAQKKRKEKTNSNRSSPLKICAKYKDETVTHDVLSQSHVAEDQKNGQFGDRHGDSEEAVFLEPFSTVHSIILDWTSATFIDSVGAKAIRQVIKEYAAVDVRVVIAGCNRNLLAELDTLKFFTKDLTTDFLFPTVHDAVLHCQHSNSHPSVAAVSDTT
ncbi:prestin [Pundamilia nyererei]|uniref:Prestin n=1 Tax=Pundamilia nyererei TaxID=303518 RepID=A0A9Y6J5U2_9CICH|nr:PREDICTED: prestin [Pundamilia nyererei]